MSPSAVPYLSETELEQLAVTADDAVSAIEAVITARVEGSAWMAPKAALLNR